VNRHGTIIFLHHPKTAGITLYNLLRRKLIFSHLPSWLDLQRARGYATLEFEDRVRLIQELSARQQKGIRMCHGHFGFGMHEHFKVPSFYFSVYREPIARAYSAYKYIIDRKTRIRLPPEATVREALNAGPVLRNFMLDNQQVRYMAGSRGEIIMNEPVTRTMLDVAIERLNNDIEVVGLQEQFLETIVLLGRWCGWKSTALVSYNKSGRAQGTQKASDLNQADRDALTEGNQFDLEFYEHVKMRFKRDLDRFGEAEMAAALEKHEDQCRRDAWKIRTVDALSSGLGKPLRRLTGS